LLDRVDTAYRQGYAKPNPEIGTGSRELASHYVLHNMLVTTSGNYLPAAYFCTRDVLGLDKILLATDYPFEKMALGIDFIKSLPISDEERAQVCEGNAARLGFAG
jgi:predicted TIM-barrel fold metal-dependent hydrolase